MLALRRQTATLAPKFLANPNFVQDVQRRTFLAMIKQYERGVTLTFGKLTSVKNPGLCINLPIIQQIFRVDMRTRVRDLPPQEVITLDNVTIRVDGVAQYKIVDPKKSSL